MDPQTNRSAYKNWDSLKCFSNFLAKKQYVANLFLTATTADLPFMKSVLNYSGIYPGILTRKDGF